MKDLRPDTLDAVEARDSHRVGLVSLAVVTGCLLAAMAMAVSSSGGGADKGANASDCQRLERSATGKTSQHARSETLLLCSGGARS